MQAYPFCIATQDAEIDTELAFTIDTNNNNDSNDECVTV